MRTASTSVSVPSSSLLSARSGNRRAPAAARLLAAVHDPLAAPSRGWNAAPLLCQLLSKTVQQETERDLTFHPKVTNKKSKAIMSKYGPFLDEMKVRARSGNSGRVLSRH